MGTMIRAKFGSIKDMDAPSFFIFIFFFRKETCLTETDVSSSACKWNYNF